MNRCYVCGKELVCEGCKKKVENCDCFKKENIGDIPIAAIAGDLFG